MRKILQEERAACADQTRAPTSVPPGRPRTRASVPHEGNHRGGEALPAQWQPRSLNRHVRIAHQMLPLLLHVLAGLSPSCVAVISFCAHRGHCSAHYHGEIAGKIHAPGAAANLRFFSVHSVYLLVFFHHFYFLDSMVFKSRCWWGPQTCGC